jgi:hypothetical protein
MYTTLLSATRNTINQGNMPLSENQKQKQSGQYLEANQAEEE